MKVVRVSNGIGCAGDLSCGCASGNGMASGFNSESTMAGMPLDKGAFDSSMSTITFPSIAPISNGVGAGGDSAAMNILSGNPLQPSIVGMDDGSGTMYPPVSPVCSVLAWVNQNPLLAIAGVGLLAMLFKKGGR